MKIMVTFLPYSVSSVGGFVEKVEPKVKIFVISVINFENFV